MIHAGDENQASLVSPEALVPLVLDVWRLSQKMPEERDPLTQRMLARIEALGFSLESYQGQLYDENLKVRVVEHSDGDGARTISSCLTPSIFFHGQLLKPANVITAGSKN